MKEFPHGKTVVGCLGTAEEMQRNLQNARIERVGEGIKITFESGILFDYDSAALRSQARTNIDNRPWRGTTRSRVLPACGSPRSTNPQGQHGRAGVSSARTA